MARRKGKARQRTVHGFANRGIVGESFEERLAQRQKIDAYTDRRNKKLAEERRRSPNQGAAGPSTDKSDERAHELASIEAKGQQLLALEQEKNKAAATAKSRERKNLIEDRAFEEGVKDNTSRRTITEKESEVALAKDLLSFQHGLDAPPKEMKVYHGTDVEGGGLFKDPSKMTSETIDSLAVLPKWLQKGSLGDQVDFSGVKAPLSQHDLNRVAESVGTKKKKPAGIGPGMSIWPGKFTDDFEDVIY